MRYLPLAATRMEIYDHKGPFLPFYLRSCFFQFVHRRPDKKFGFGLSKIYQWWSSGLHNVGVKSININCETMMESGQDHFAYFPYFDFLLYIFMVRVSSCKLMSKWYPRKLWYVHCSIHFKF